MADIKIELSSIELNVDETATIYTFDSPRTYLFQSTPELISAGVSVQTYGVITVPTDATLTGQEIVEVEYVNKVYSALLSNIISASEGDEISFTSLFITVGDLTDVEIKDLTDFDILSYDKTKNKWINIQGLYRLSPESPLIYEHESDDELIPYTFHFEMHPNPQSAGYYIGHIDEQDLPELTIDTPIENDPTLKMVINNKKYPCSVLSLHDPDFELTLNGDGNSYTFSYREQDGYELYTNNSTELIDVTIYYSIAEPTDMLRFLFSLLNQ